MALMKDKTAEDVEDILKVIQLASEVVTKGC